MSESAGVVRLPQSSARGKHGIIDVHFHPIVPAIIASTKAIGPTSVADAPFMAMMQSWTTEGALALMDASGVDVAVQSIVLPYGLPADARAARNFVARANEEAADIMHRHPTRFGLLGALSMTGTPTTLEEIANVLDVLKADGVGLLTHYQGVRLGDPLLDPVLAELDRRSTVVFVHPALPSIPTPPIRNVVPAHTELAFEATRTIASLLFNGALTRYPNIRFIFTHGGAAVPMLAERWEQMARQLPAMGAAVPEGVHAILARQHYDLATVAHPTPFASLSKMTPASHVLFGSDSPFLPMAAGAQGLAELELPASSRTAIQRGNAEALFPRLRAL
jgi:predicted TIM-barrel fold metal-dependent hydrolase